MSDRFAATISIGGKVSRTAKSRFDPDETVLNALIGEINQSGVSHEFGDAPVNIQNEEELLKYLDNNGHLCFRHAQATYGEFDELEDFLIVHGIPFDRWSDQESLLQAKHLLQKLCPELPDELEKFEIVS